MSRKRLSLLLALPLCFAVSCASTTVKRHEVSASGVPANESERQDKGIRFYEAAPFILVYVDNQTYHADLIYLPDTTTIFSASPQNLFGINNTTLEFEKGILTKSTVDVDSTAIPKKLIESAKTLAAAARAAAPDDGAAAVFLYRVGVDSAGKPALIHDGITY